MTLQTTGRAPYTSASAAVTALDAFRSRSPGGPVTTDMLVKLGVPESISKRTLNSLVELELVTDDGKPTEILEAFKQIKGDDEYRARLQEWLRDLYAEVLPFGNPSEDSVEKIQEAFRGYDPEGQRKAMASLFVGLWEYAGLPIVTSENTASTRPTGSRSRRSTPRKKTKQGQPPTGDPGVLFGITEDDIAALSEEEFDEVWSALGKVARARSRKNGSDEPSQTSEVSEQEVSP